MQRYFYGTKLQHFIGYNYMDDVGGAPNIVYISSSETTYGASLKMCRKFRNNTDVVHSYT